MNLAAFGKSCISWSGACVCETERMVTWWQCRSLHRKASLWEPRGSTWMLDLHLNASFQSSEAEQQRKGHCRSMAGMTSQFPAPQSRSLAITSAASEPRTILLNVLPLFLDCLTKSWGLCNLYYCSSSFIGAIYTCDSEDNRSLKLQPKTGFKNLGSIFLRSIS